MKLQPIQIITPFAGVYLITRTSACGGQPHADAVPVKVIHIDSRDCDDPKKIPANRGKDGDWYLKGTNHRVENGYIKRDIGLRDAWAIDVSDIMMFVDANGSCMLNRDENGFATIEIYDDYRE